MFYVIYLTEPNHQLHKKKLLNTQPVSKLYTHLHTGIKQFYL